MARSRPSMTTTASIPMPVLGPVDLAPWISMTQDLIAQSTRLWVDLWFRNANLATGAFWADVRERSSQR